MAGTTSASPRAAHPSPARRGLQVAAALTLLAVVAQFVTAGQLLGPGQLLGAGAAVGAHGAGAVVLHVVSGLAAVAALVDLRSGGSRGVAALAVVLLGLTFLQAWSGDHASLAVHVPLALSVVVGAAWLLAAAVGVGARRSDG
ncbi:hypothetical protein [uncultured Pseudokineococcus sp.]|uniref:hypothetical protein n=1 Tax=uncultured Pseudokineococcus sp. TaxID=1642928 RepID=UPI00260771E7|nr:hypothetical protein [uncultured Pseudokineococcus sp.]